MKFIVNIPDYPNDSYFKVYTEDKRPLYYIRNRPWSWRLRFELTNLHDEQLLEVRGKGMGFKSFFQYRYHMLKSGQRVAQIDLRRYTGELSWKDWETNTDITVIEAPDEGRLRIFDEDKRIGVIQWRTTAPKPFFQVDVPEATHELKVLAMVYLFHFTHGQQFPTPTG